MDGNCQMMTEYSGMVILQDSRQQSGRHDIKNRWFMEHGVMQNRTKLVCGDYQLPGDGSIAVDTKQSCAEIIGDIQVKTMGKKAILEEVQRIFAENYLPMPLSETAYHLITDDDADRFAEQEISNFCFRAHIPENVLSKLQDLYVKRHGFFHRGLLRAKHYGIKLYIVVENNDGVTTLSDLFRWQNPRSRIMKNSNIQIGWNRNGTPKFKKIPKYPNAMRGETLAKACITMEKKYGCTFLFCRPEESAELIMQLLIKRKEY